MIKVSIITVCFNSLKTIGRTIDSVKKQDYENIEFVVIDGGSSDGTVELISRESRINNYISEPDSGIYDAMNKGLSMASGELITFLNADDSFANVSVVSRMVKCFNSDPDLQVLFGDVLFVKEGKTIRHYSSKKFRPWKLRFGWMPAHPGSVVRREAFEKSGFFDTQFKISADFEMFIRLLYKHKLMYRYLDSVLVNMEYGGASTESNSARLRLNREIVQACRKNGLYTNLALVLLKIPVKLLEFINAKRFS